VGPAAVTDANGNSINITNPARNGDTISLTALPWAQSRATKRSRRP